MKQKEATSIISSLRAGVVPSYGIQHIVVGRDLETKAIVNNLRAVASGQNVVKFWVGDFGSGKSFMFHLTKALAHQENFVVANADLNPDISFYSNDGKSLALFRALMSNLSIKTKPEGGALGTLIDKWITKIMDQVMEANSLTMDQIREPENILLVERAIKDKLSDITDTGGFELPYVVIKYFQGYINGNDQLRMYALKWLQGEFSTRTEARTCLGVRDIVNDHNYYDVLKCMCKMFVSMGYAGLVINIDEAVNLYKITRAPLREKNYEKILSIYNDCYQGRDNHLYINIAGDPKFMFNTRKGMFSYDALKTRLEPNKYTSSTIKDFSQPVIQIEPISMEDILILLKNLRNIFNTANQSNIELTDEQITWYMEVMYNKPGAAEYLLPRVVIRDFLDALNSMLQNPGVSFESLINSIEIEIDANILDKLDEITEL